MRASPDNRPTYALTAEQTGAYVQPHATILVIPNVLSREECGQLVQSFEKGGPLKK
jgi:hypothetical protein